MKLKVKQTIVFIGLIVLVLLSGCIDNNKNPNEIRTFLSVEYKDGRSAVNEYPYSVNGYIDPQNPMNRIDIKDFSVKYDRDIIIVQGNIETQWDDTTEMPEKAFIHITILDGDNRNMIASNNAFERPIRLFKHEPSLFIEIIKRKS